jgi:hypothetical protein
VTLARSRRLLTSVAVALVAATAPAVAYAKGNEETTNTTTARSAGVAPALPTLSTRLVLPKRTVRAGSPLNGTLIVTSTSERTIDLSASTPNHCAPQFGVSLTNRQFPPSTTFPAVCIPRPFPLHPGKNRFPFTVQTSYAMCAAGDPPPSPEAPRCDQHLRSPPLPVGGYDAVRVGDGTLALPEPRPVTITLT